MEAMHICDQFAAKLDDARSLSTTMSLQQRVEAIRLLFTFLEHLQRDMIEALCGVGSDLVHFTAPTALVNPDNKTPDDDGGSDTEVYMVNDGESSSPRQLFADATHGERIANGCDENLDGEHIRAELRNKILTNTDATPRRQRARKSMAHKKGEDNTARLQRQLTESLGLTPRYPVSVGSLTNSTTPSASTSYSTNRLPLSSFAARGSITAGTPSFRAIINSPITIAPDNKSPLTTDQHGGSSSQAGHDTTSCASAPRRQKRRREKVNGRYACTHEGCTESYSNLEHVEDHEHQHSTPDGRYLACSFDSCSKRFKWRHYLRRHEKTHHSCSATSVTDQHATNLIAAPDMLSMHKLSQLNYERTDHATN